MTFQKLPYCALSLTSSATSALFRGQPTHGRKALLQARVQRAETNEAAELAELPA